MLNSCCYTFLISSQNGRSYLSVEHSAFSVFNRAESCYGEVQTLKDVLALAVFRTANILIAQLVRFVSPSNLLNSSGLLDVRMSSSSSNCLRHLVLGNNGLHVHLTAGEGGRRRQKEAALPSPPPGSLGRHGEVSFASKEHAFGWRGFGCATRARQPQGMSSGAAGTRAGASPAVLSRRAAQLPSRPGSPPNRWGLGNSGTERACVAPCVQEASK